MIEKPNPVKNLKKGLKTRSILHPKLISLFLMIEILLSSVFIISNSALASQTLWTQTDWQNGEGHSSWDSFNPNYYESKTNNLDDSSSGDIELKEKLIHITMGVLLGGDSGEVATWTSGFGYRAGKVTNEKGIQINDPDQDNSTYNGDYFQYSRGDSIDSVIYNHFNPNQGTIRLWIKPNWNGNDGKSHYIFDNYLVSPYNYLVVHKDALNKMEIRIRQGADPAKGDFLGIASSDVSSWQAGEWHHIVATWDSKRDISGTSNLAIYIDNVKSAGTDGYWQHDGVHSNFTISASNGPSAYQADSTLSGLLIDDRPWTDSEVASDYNLGSGKESIASPDTRFFLGANKEETLDSVSWDQTPYNAGTNTNGNIVEDGNQEDGDKAEWVESGSNTETPKAYIEKVKNEKEAYYRLLKNNTDYLDLDNINDIYIYDTTQDTIKDTWRTNSSKSWYTETLNTSQRGSTRPFPKKAILIATNSYLYIFDASTSLMWMRFDKGNQYYVLLDDGSSQTPRSVFALNGKVYIGGKINAGSGGGLFIVNFITDSATLCYDSAVYQYQKTLSQRNLTGTFAATWGTNTGETIRLIDEHANDVHAAVINAKTYIAVATDGGVSVINETDGSVKNGTPAGGYGSDHVWLTSDNEFYWGMKNNSSGDTTLLSFYNFTNLSNYNWGSQNKSYHAGVAIPALWSFNNSNSNIHNDLFVTENTSILDSDSNTIYVANNSGICILQENQGDESNGSVKYYTKDYISEEMVGDIRGYWDMDEDPSGSAPQIKDRSLGYLPDHKVNDLTSAGTMTSGDEVAGVRGNALDFDGGDDYLWRNEPIDYIFNYDNAAGGDPFESGNYSVNYANSNSWTLFSDNANTEVGDSIYFGDDTTFTKLVFNIGVAKSANVTFTWEYYKSGVGWTSFTPTDNTNNFTTTGLNQITWSTLSSWTTKSINSQTKYWIRCRISSFTDWTTNPTYDGTSITPNRPIQRDGDFDITGSFTVGAWIKISGGLNAYRGIISKYTSSNNRSLGLSFANTNKLRLWLSSDGVSPTTYKDSTSTYTSTTDWYHVVGVYNASSQTISLYINGQEDPGTLTGTVPASIFNGAAPFEVASFDGVVFLFNGQIDEPFITAEALSESVIRDMYKKGKRALAMGSTVNKLSGSSNQVNSISVTDDFIEVKTGSVTLTSNAVTVQTNIISKANEFNNFYLVDTDKGSIQKIVSHTTGVNTVFTVGSNFNVTVNDTVSIRRKDVKPNYIYVGTQDGVTKLDLNSDSKIDSWYVGDLKVDDNSRTLSNDSIKSISTNDNLLSFATDNEIWSESENSNLNIKYDNFSTKLTFYNDNDSSYLDEDLTLNQTYYLRFNYKLPSVNPNNIKFTLEGAGAIIPETSLTKDGSFHEYETTFKADQTGTHRLKFIQDGTTESSSNLFLDNVILHETTSTLTDNAWYSFPEQNRRNTFKKDSTQDTSQYQLSFDGVDDYVNIADNSTLDISGELTLSAWVKINVPNSTNYGGVAKYTNMIDHYNERAYGFWFLGGATKPSCTVSDDGTANPGHYTSVSSVTDIGLNIWTHILVVFKPSTYLRIYVNGKLDSETTSSVVSSIYNSPAPLWLGTNFDTTVTGRFMKGQLDEVRIWNYALSQSQIQERMYKEIDSSDPLWSNLVGYWKFNEGSGQVASDSSSNSNDGQLGSTPGVDVNDPTWQVSPHVELDSFSPSTSTPSSEANSHYIDKFGTLSDSVLIDGADTLSYSTIGNISNSKGTVSFWFRPLLPYNKYSENKYLINSEDVTNKLVRLYYNYSDYKYHLQFFNGTNWTTVQSVSSVQSFSKDTWQHILLTYDNTVGVNLYVNGSSDGTYSGSWTAQTLPTNIYVGSLYNSTANTNQADSYFDDLAIYDYVLNLVEINNLYTRSTELGRYASLTPAILVSSVYDTTHTTADYNFVGFLNLSSYNIPSSNEEITIEIRSGDAPTPDFTWTSWNTVVSGLDPTQEDNNQYIQYRLTFNSTTEDNTPSVNDFTIGYLPSPSQFPAPPEEPLPLGEEDQDSDGMPGTWESEHGLNPSDPSDADLDNDNDGLTNKEEYQYNTDPNNKDSDNDKYTDKVEIQHGTDPNNPEDNPHDICLQYYKNFKVNPLCRMKEVEEQIETRISNKLQEIIKEFFGLR